jgi:hypothetical protein
VLLGSLFVFVCEQEIRKTEDYFRSSLIEIRKGKLHKLTFEYIKNIDREKKWKYIMIP